MATDQRPGRDFVIRNFENYFSQSLLRNSALKQLSDVQLRGEIVGAGDERVHHLHKAILGTHSHLLRDVLEGISQALEICICIPDVDSDSLEHFVSLLYTGVSDHLRETHVHEIESILKSIGAPNPGFSSNYRLELSSTPANGGAPLVVGYDPLPLTQVMANAVDVRHSVTPTIVNVGRVDIGNEGMDKNAAQASGIIPSTYSDQTPANNHSFQEGATAVPEVVSDSDNNGVNRKSIDAHSSTLNRQSFESQTKTHPVASAQPAGTVDKSVLTAKNNNVTLKNGSIDHHSIARSIQETDYNKTTESRSNISPQDETIAVQMLLNGKTAQAAKMHSSANHRESESMMIDVIELSDSDDDDDNCVSPTSHPCVHQSSPSPTIKSLRSLPLANNNDTSRTNLSTKGFSNIHSSTLPTDNELDCVSLTGNIINNAGPSNVMRDARESKAKAAALVSNHDQVTRLDASKQHDQVTIKEETAEENYNFETSTPESSASSASSRFGSVRGSNIDSKIITASTETHTSPQTAHSGFRCNELRNLSPSSAAPVSAAATVPPSKTQHPSSAEFHSMVGVPRSGTDNTREIADNNFQKAPASPETIEISRPSGLRNRSLPDATSPAATTATVSAPVSRVPSVFEIANVKFVSASDSDNNSNDNNASANELPAHSGSSVVCEVITLDDDQDENVCKHKIAAQRNGLSADSFCHSSTGSSAERANERNSNTVQDALREAQQHEQSSGDIAVEQSGLKRSIYEKASSIFCNTSSRNARNEKQLLNESVHREQQQLIESEAEDSQRSTLAIDQGGPLSPNQGNGTEIQSTPRCPTDEIEVRNDVSTPFLEKSCCMIDGSAIKRRRQLLRRRQWLRRTPAWDRKQKKKVAKSREPSVEKIVSPQESNVNAGNHRSQLMQYTVSNGGPADNHQSQLMQNMVSNGGPADNHHQSQLMQNAVSNSGPTDNHCSQLMQNAVRNGGPTDSHGSQLMQNALSNGGPVACKTHSCFMCSFSTNRRSVLRGHVLKHSDEKPGHSAAQTIDKKTRDNSASSHDGDRQKVPISKHTSQRAKSQLSDNDENRPRIVTEMANPVRVPLSAETDNSKCDEIREYLRSVKDADASGTAISCKYCKKEFSSIQSLTGHIAAAHLKRVQQSCMRETPSKSRKKSAHHATESNAQHDHSVTKSRNKLKQYLDSLKQSESGGVECKYCHKKLRHLCYLRRHIQWFHLRMMPVMRRDSAGRFTSKSVGYETSFHLKEKHVGLTTLTEEKPEQPKARTISDETGDICSSGAGKPKSKNDQSNHYLGHYNADNSSSKNDTGKQNCKNARQVNPSELANQSNETELSSNGKRKRVEETAVQFKNNRSSNSALRIRSSTSAIHQSAVKCSDTAGAISNRNYRHSKDQKAVIAEKEKCVDYLRSLKKSDFPSRALINCKFCGNDYSSFNSFKTHINTIHLNIRPHACRFSCGQRFAEANKCRLHEWKAHSERIKQIGIKKWRNAKSTTKFEENVEEQQEGRSKTPAHVSDIEGDQRSNACLRQSNKLRLQQKRRTQFKKPHFQSINSLNSDSNKVSQDGVSSCKGDVKPQRVSNSATRAGAGAVGKFVCRFCRERFATTYSLVQHLNRDHIEKKTVACSFCDISFFRKHALHKHELKWHPVCESDQLGGGGDPRQSKPDMLQQSKCRSESASEVHSDEREMHQDMNHVDEVVSGSDECQQGSGFSGDLERQCRATRDEGTDCELIESKSYVILNLGADKLPEGREIKVENDFNSDMDLDMELDVVKSEKSTSGRTQRNNTDDQENNSGVSIADKFHEEMEYDGSNRCSNEFERAEINDAFSKFCSSDANKTEVTDDISKCCSSEIDTVELKEEFSNSGISNVDKGETKDDCFNRCSNGTGCDNALCQDAINDAESKSDSPYLSKTVDSVGNVEAIADDSDALSFDFDEELGLLFDDGESRDSGDNVANAHEVQTVTTRLLFHDDEHRETVNNVANSPGADQFTTSALGDANDAAIVSDIIGASDNMEQLNDELDQIIASFASVQDATFPQTHSETPGEAISTQNESICDSESDDNARISQPVAGDAPAIVGAQNSVIAATVSTEVDGELFVEFDKNGETVNPLALW